MSYSTANRRAARNRIAALIHQWMSRMETSDQIDFLSGLLDYMTMPSLQELEREARKALASNVINPVEPVDDETGYYLQNSRPEEDHGKAAPEELE